MCVHVTKVYNTKGTPSCSHRVCKMHTIHAKVRQERLVCAHSAHSVHIICAMCAHSAHNVFKSKGRTPTKHKPAWGIGAGDRILALTKGFHALCLYVCNMLLPFKVLPEVLLRPSILSNPSLNSESTGQALEGYQMNCNEP